MDATSAEVGWNQSDSGRSQEQAHADQPGEHPREDSEEDADGRCQSTVIDCADEPEVAVAQYGHRKLTNG